MRTPCAPIAGIPMSLLRIPAVGIVCAVIACCVPLCSARQNQVTDRSGSVQKNGAKSPDLSKEALLPDST